MTNEVLQSLRRLVRKFGERLTVEWDSIVRILHSSYPQIVASAPFSSSLIPCVIDMLSKMLRLKQTNALFIDHEDMFCLFIRYKDFLPEKLAEALLDFIEVEAHPIRKNWIEMMSLLFTIYCLPITIHSTISSGRSRAKNEEDRVNSSGFVASKSFTFGTSKHRGGVGKGIFESSRYHVHGKNGLRIPVFNRLPVRLALRALKIFENRLSMYKGTHGPMLCSTLLVPFITNVFCCPQLHLSVYLELIRLVGRVLRWLSPESNAFSPLLVLLERSAYKPPDFSVKRVGHVSTTAQDAQQKKQGEMAVGVAVAEGDLFYNPGRRVQVEPSFELETSTETIPAPCAGLSSASSASIAKEIISSPPYLGLKPTTTPSALISSPSTSSLLSTATKTASSSSSSISTPKMTTAATTMSVAGTTDVISRQSQKYAAVPTSSSLKKPLARLSTMVLTSPRDKKLAHTDKKSTISVPVTEQDRDRLLWAQQFIAGKKNDPVHDLYASAPTTPHRSSEFAFGSKPTLSRKCSSHRKGPAVDHDKNAPEASARNAYTLEEIASFKTPTRHDRSNEFSVPSWSADSPSIMAEMGTDMGSFLRISGTPGTGVRESDTQRRKKAKARARHWNKQDRLLLRDMVLTTIGKLFEDSLVVAPHTRALAVFEVLCRLAKSHKYPPVRHQAILYLLRLRGTRDFGVEYVKQNGVVIRSTVFTCSNLQEVPSPSLRSLDNIASFGSSAAGTISVTRGEQPYGGRQGRQENTGLCFRSGGRRGQVQPQTERRGCGHGSEGHGLEGRRGVAGPKSLVTPLV